jgi:hypothetical protein
MQLLQNDGKEEQADRLDLSSDYLQGRRPAILFKGAMSFYPLLNDEKQLKELDGGCFR